MGFALVVGLGHDGGGEEHVTQGAALVPVHLCLCTVLVERKGGGGHMQGTEREKRGSLKQERGTLCNEPSPSSFFPLSLSEPIKYSCISLGWVCGCAL